MSKQPPSRPPLDLSLYLVTSSAHTGRDRLVSTVLSAVTGGVTIVQLREPDAPDAEVLVLARDLVAALKPTGVPLLIDDRVHLVELADAQGAHVGQTDLPVDHARAMLGTDRLLGLSTHTAEQARQAAAGGHVDYVGIGPAWPTSTKHVDRDALGPGGIREVAEASALPSVAIGGIDAERTVLLRDAGIDGVAVVSAICGARDPRAAAIGIRAAWDSGIAP